VIRTKNMMRNRKGGWVGLAVALLASLALAAAGCGGEEGPAERAGEQIDETAEEMEERVRDAFEDEGAAERAGEQVDEAAEKARQELGEAAESAREAMGEAAEEAEEEMEEAEEQMQ